MRLCMFFLGIAALAWASPQQQFTIDDLISARHAMTIRPTWAPDGRSFFYEDQDGVSLYQVADHKAHAWFHSEDLEKAATPVNRPKEFGWQNRRVNAASYQWFPNSKDLLASAGGDLFVIHADGKREQITKTDIGEDDPHLAPDGTKVTYRWRSNLYVLDLATHQAKQLTTDGTPTLLNGELDWVYPEELDLGTAVWWSPDSKSIAYMQFDVHDEFVYPQVALTGERAYGEPERYPQAGTPNAEVKIGIVAVENGGTKWLDLGSTARALLARVAWLPDSKQVAIERLNRVQDKLDLLLADAATGETKTMLHEDSKTWINVTEGPLFLKGSDEFLWTSERTGFRHIYRYKTSGELVSQLTKGDWEVVAITAVDEKGGRIYYTSRETSPLETQLYSIALTGGTPMRLTKEEGTHSIGMNEQGTHYVDSYSSLREPRQTVLASTDGASRMVLQAAEKKNPALLPEEIVAMKASDGTTLYGRLIKPAGFREGTKYPLLVSVYGGPGVQVVVNRWAGESFAQVLAHAGYVVWTLDNRGSYGRGMAFEAPIYRKMGFQEVADQKAGVEFLVAKGFVDPKRVGIFGFSYGGYMTLRSLLYAGDTFRAGVAGAPVTDWHNYDTIYTERYMGLPDENREAYDASSNVKNAERLKGRLIIIHNIEDDNVLFQNTMQMSAALERAGKSFVMQIYPQKTHGIFGPYQKEFDEEMLGFFEENVKR